MNDKPLGFTISVRLSDDRKGSNSITISTSHVVVESYAELVPAINTVAQRAVRELTKRGAPK